jgi:hypothetical protein
MGCRAPGSAARTRPLPPRTRRPPVRHPPMSRTADIHQHVTVSAPVGCTSSAAGCSSSRNRASAAAARLEVERDALRGAAARVRVCQRIVQLGQLRALLRRPAPGRVRRQAQRRAQALMVAVVVRRARQQAPGGPHARACLTS